MQANINSKALNFGVYRSIDGAVLMFYNKFWNKYIWASIVLASMKFYIYHQYNCQILLVNFGVYHLTNGVLCLQLWGWKFSFFVHTISPKLMNRMSWKFKLKCKLIYIGEHWTWLHITQKVRLLSYSFQDFWDRNFSAFIVPKSQNFFMLLHPNWDVMNIIWCISFNRRHCFTLSKIYF